MPTVTAPSATPTVIGWNTSASATTNNSSYSTSTGNILLTSSNTGKTWYAITKKNAVTLKATANTNGSGLSGSTTPTCTIAESYNGIAQATSCEVTMPTVSPRDNTPIFVGWNLSASGTTNDSSYNMTTNKLTLTNSNTGKNWYAITKKEAVTLTAKVDANSGTLSSTSDVGCTIGETYNAMGQASSCTAKMPTATKTGYSHTGWNTDAKATTNDSSYNTSSGSLKLTKDNTGTTWYAIYAAKSYKVTFNPNGGTVTPTYKLVTFDLNYGEDGTLPTPTRADSTDSASGKTISYVFEGWYTAANGGTKVTDETLVNTASDHSIYAHWISKPIITGGSADWFNKEVNIELEVPSTSDTDTNSLIYEYYVSTSNSSQVGGEWRRASDSGYAPVSANGIHYVFFRAMNQQEYNKYINNNEYEPLTSPISNFQTVKIDTDNPTLSVTGNPTSWVTTDVTLKVSASDSTSGLKNVTVNGKALSLSSGIVNYTVSANGTYTFVATDVAGNTTTQSVVVSKIDKVTPTAPVLTGGSASWTTACGTIKVGTAGTTGPSGIAHYEAELENMLNGGSIHRGYNQLTYKDNGYWQTTGTDPYVAFNDLGNVYMTHARVGIASATPVAMQLQVFYWTEGSSATEANSRTVTVPAGTSGYVDIDIPDGTYDGLRFDFGNTANVTYQFQFWGYVRKYTTSDTTSVCNRGLNRVRYRTVANNGLISNWSDYDSNNGSKVLINNDVIYDSGTGLTYSTFQKAVNVLGGSGGSQNLQMRRSTTENIAIGAGSFKVDMKGYAVRGYIKNYSTLSLQSGTIDTYDTNETSALVNTNTLTLNSVSLSCYKGVTLDTSYGNVSITNGTIFSDISNSILVRSGNVSITGGQVWTKNASAVKITSGTVTFNSGTLYADGGNAFNGAGTINIKAGLIYSNTNAGISSTGTVNMSGGKLYSNDGNAIYSTGTINITGGTIYSNTNSGIYSNGAITIGGGEIYTNTQGKNGVYIASGTAKMTNGEVRNVVNDSSCGGALTLSSTSTNGFTMEGGYIHGCVGINQQDGASGTITINNSQGKNTRVVGDHSGISISSSTNNLLKIGTSGNTSKSYPLIESTGDNYYAVKLPTTSVTFQFYSGILKSSGKTAVFRGKRAGSCPSGKKWTVNKSSSPYSAYCK